MTVGTNAPIKKTPPTPGTKSPKPTASRSVALGAAIITGIFAIVFTYRLGFNPQDYLGDNFGDIVILTSVLWITMVGFLAIGTQSPIPKPGPTPPKKPEETHPE